MPRRMPSQTVDVVRLGAVATMTMGRAGGDNRVDGALASALASACADLDADDAVRVVVLTGAGGVFSADMADPAPDGSLVRAASTLASVRKPTVAAINGDCLDQGLELAMACDLRVAVRSARLGLRHVAQGWLPWDGGTQRLVRWVGRAQALRLLLTSELITADEAHRIGLVQCVADDRQLDEAVDALATAVAEGAPTAAAYAKEAVAGAGDLTVEQGLRLEADLSILLQGTEGRAEGLRSFAEHRPPRQGGR